MSDPYIDTDVIIRLLTGDDPSKQAAAQRLFEGIEARALTVAAPDTVIADAVYVLSSPRLYAQPRAQVAAMLSRLVQLPSFKVSQRNVVLDALALYAEHPIDFGDAMLLASMQATGATALYSYDGDFDRFAGIERLEPS